MRAQNAWDGTASWADPATSWTGSDLYMPGTATPLFPLTASMTPLAVATPTMTGA